MDHRNIFAALLLIFVSIGSGCQDVKQSDQTLKENDPKSIAITYSPPNNERAPEKASHTVIAYYFHRTFRCPSCLAIEALSLQALQSAFAQALQDGTLQWLVVNMDEPGGKEFVKDFNLVTSSLVIADVQNGKQVRWKKLERVWQLKGNRDAFVKYVQDEAAGYLATD